MPKMKDPQTILETHNNWSVPNVPRKWEQNWYFFFFLKQNWKKRYKILKMSRFLI